MNTYLNCPYSQKHVAKQHGAKWDAERKQWYYPGTELPEALKQYETRNTNGSGPNGRPFYRCPKCGTTGHGGGYPFSTCPPTCDDCN